MGYNSKDELMDDLAAASTSAFTITWTTNTPTASTTATIADGDVVTTAELGAIIFNQQAQITALIADVLLIQTDLNA